MRFQPGRDGKSSLMEATLPSENRYLLVAEAARLCRVHYKTVLTWIYTGRIPASKVGHRWLIAADDLDAILAGKA